MSRPRLAVTVGDPAGIGPELAVRLAAEPEFRERAELILYGPPEVIRAAARQFTPGWTPALEAVGMQSFRTATSSRLSGGQKQRIAIAGVLALLPKIMILDESTSALDLGTESAIMDTIAALKGQLTIIIIAHRLSTVEHCDRLIWMENGRIHRIGTPQELLPEYMKSFGV